MCVRVCVCVCVCGVCVYVVGMYVCTCVYVCMHVGTFGLGSRGLGLGCQSWAQGDGFVGCSRRRCFWHQR